MSTESRRASIFLLTSVSGLKQGATLLRAMTEKNEAHMSNLDRFHLWVQAFVKCMQGLRISSLSTRPITVKCYLQYP